MKKNEGDTDIVKLSIIQKQQKLQLSWKMKKYRHLARFN